jgi:hypothetical protein
MKSLSGWNLHHQKLSSLRLAGILLLLLQKQAENDELLAKQEVATNSLAEGRDLPEAVRRLHSKKKAPENGGLVGC